MNELETLSSGFEDMGWPEGKYIDNWTVIHIFAGAGIGVALKLLKIRYPTDLIAATVIMCGWEIYERSIPPIEYHENHITDIFAGLAGFGAIKLLMR